jgi:hypothetical protein
MFETISPAIRAVDFKSSALNSSISNKLRCQAAAKSRQPLLYAEVRWFSKGKVLKRAYVLREELAVFLADERKMKLKDIFSWGEKLNQIAYFSYLLGLLNQLNILYKVIVCLHIFIGQDKIKFFRLKWT